VNWFKVSFNVLGKDYKAELMKARDWIEIDNNAAIDNDGCIFMSFRVPHNKTYRPQID
jgi:hypothetical protein